MPKKPLVLGHGRRKMWQLRLILSYRIYRVMDGI